MIEAMQKNLAGYRKALDRIRADRDISGEARSRMMNEAHTAAREEYRRIFGEGRSRASRSYDEAARSVFGPPAPRDASTAERAAIASSYRDALFRVSGVEDAGQLHTFQAMAQATGDKLLSRAILYRGGEMGEQSLVDAVCVNDPDLERGWNGLMERAREMNTQGDPLAAGLHAPPRPEDMPADSPAEAG